MNSTIQISFRYEERDYVRAVRAHYGALLKVPLDIIGIICLAVAGVYLWRSSSFHFAGTALVGLAAICAVLLVSAFTIVPLLIFRNEPKLRDEYALTFSEEGIHFGTANIDSRLQWGMYTH